MNKISEVRRTVAVCGGSFGSGVCGSAQSVKLLGMGLRRAVCKAVRDGSAPRSLQSCPMPSLRGRLIHVCFICVASRSTRITPLSRYSVPSRATQQHVHSHVCSNVIGQLCRLRGAGKRHWNNLCRLRGAASVTGTIFTDCTEQRIVDKISLERYNKDATIVETIPYSRTSRALEKWRCQRWIR